MHGLRTVEWYDVQRGVQRNWPNTAQAEVFLIGERVTATQAAGETSGTNKVRRVRRVEVHE